MALISDQSALCDDDDDDDDAVIPIWRPTEQGWQRFDPSAVLPRQRLMLGLLAVVVRVTVAAVVAAVTVAPRLLDPSAKHWVVARDPNRARMRHCGEGLSSPSFGGALLRLLACSCGSSSWRGDRNKSGAVGGVILRTRPCLFVECTQRRAGVYQL